MLVWKLSTLLAICAVSPAIALAAIVGWSLLTDGMFTVSLGSYGAAFIGRFAAGINLEDEDGGYHGVAFVYFETTHEDAKLSRVIRSRMSGASRKQHGVSYVGAPERP